MQHPGSPPFIRFFQLYPDSPAPQQADPSLFGSAPLRGVRHCEPFTAGSGFGWYAFPPINFSLLWDGTSAYWCNDDADNPEWELFRTVALPGFSTEMSRYAPEDLAHFAKTPFLGRGPEPDLVQMWTGLLAQTLPGWSVVIRPPVNLARDKGVELFDGIVESDWWFGPAIAVMRLTKTDVPISFRTNQPLFQIQPVKREAYAKPNLRNFEIIHLSEMHAEDWSRIRNTMQAKEAGDSYRALVRRQQQASP